MKLPVSVLEYELGRKFRLVKAKLKDDSARYSAPLLYDGKPIEDDRVYVLTEDDLLQKQYRTPALAICTGNGNFIDFEKYRGAVICTDCTSLATLFNEVQKIFDRYQTWERQMNAILTKDKNPVQSLLDLAARTHQNMFLLQDSSFRNTQIAYTGSPQAESQWNVGTLLSSLGKQIDDVVMEKIKDYFPARRQIREVMYHNISEYETLDIPLYDGSVYIGMLSMLSYNRPFEKQDRYILEFLSSYLSYALSRVFALPEKNFGKLSSAFAALLDSKHISKKELSQICSAVGFGEKDTYRIAAIQFSTDEEAEYARYFQQIVKTNILGSIVCLKGNVMAIAVNVSVCSKSDTYWVTILDQYSREFGLKTGISDPFTNFQYCESYFTEAVYTLSLLPWESVAGVYFFRDYKIPCILRNCVGKLSPAMLYTDGFQRLLQYEQSAAVSYIETLRVYLEENLNSARAARRLHISRNTFLARYERLCSVLQEDLANPDVRFGLELSLRLYSMGK